MNYFITDSKNSHTLNNKTNQNTSKTCPMTVPRKYFFPYPALPGIWTWLKNSQGEKGGRDTVVKELHHLVSME